MTKRSGSPTNRVFHFGNAALAEEVPLHAWARLKPHLPKTLSKDVETLLRKKITQCYDGLVLDRLGGKEDHLCALAFRPPGKNQRAPFERLAHHLGEAAKAWEAVRDTQGGSDEYYEVHIVNGKATSVRASHPCDVLKTLAERAEKELEAVRPRKKTLASDSEEQLEKLRARNEKYGFPSPWANFVRRIAQCLRDAGLKPNVTGRLYSEGEQPTWFQIFMFDLNASIDPKLAEPIHGAAAFFAGITRAMREKDL